MRGGHTGKKNSGVQNLFFAWPLFVHVSSEPSKTNYVIFPCESESFWLCLKVDLSGFEFNSVQLSSIMCSPVLSSDH